MYNNDQHVPAPFKVPETYGCLFQEATHTIIRLKIPPVLAPSLFAGEKSTDHNTVNLVPYSLETVCGFLKVPQNL